MRLARFASCCIVLVLVVAGLRAAVESGHKPHKPVVLTSGDDPRFKSWTVTAYGETAPKADELALEKARQQVWDYLARQDPPLRWKPDSRWVDDNLVKSRPPAKLVHMDDPVIREAYERTLEVEVGPKQYREIVEHDRETCVEQRQLLLGRILAGLVALLVAVVGYLRLDEATKGYYTLWLRLGALALVGGVGAALTLLL